MCNNPAAGQCEIKNTIYLLTINERQRGAEENRDENKAGDSGAGSGGGRGGTAGQIPAGMGAVYSQLQPARAAENDTVWVVLRKGKQYAL